MQFASQFISFLRQSGKYIFIFLDAWVFDAAHGHFIVVRRLSLVALSWGCSLVVVCGLLTAVASSSCGALGCAGLVAPCHMGP